MSDITVRGYVDGVITLAVGGEVRNLTPAEVGTLIGDLTRALVVAAPSSGSLPANFLVYSLDPGGFAVKVALLEHAIAGARTRHRLTGKRFAVRWLTRPGAIFSVGPEGEIHGRGEASSLLPHGTPYAVDPMA